MSHRGVETVLGRLATDAGLRRRFRQAPIETLRELLAQGLELSSVELEALRSLDSAALERFARTLDQRLQRAALVEAGPPADERTGTRRRRTHGLRRGEEP
jgi:hypothetical protein